MNNLDAPPIWQRFRAIFLYALNPTPISVSLVIGLLFAWLEPGLLLAIPLLFIGIRYSVEVFNKTVKGDFEPPKVTYAVLVEDYDVTTKLFFLLFLILFLVYSVGNSVGVTAAVMLWYFFLLALPAAYMTVMLTDSLLHGINPVALVQMITRMGLSYWLLYGLLFVLSIAWMNLVDLLAGLSSARLFTVLFYMALFAFNLMAFHMMGYMVYRRGDAFGTAQAEPAAEPGPMALFEELLESGNEEAARVELRRLIADSPDDLSLYRRMHNLALVDQSVEDLRTNAGAFIPRLIAGGLAGEAVEILKDCSGLQCAPKGLKADSTLALARQLGVMNHPKQAFQLLNGFHKRYPDSPLTFDAYLFAAHLLTEELGRDDLATKLLGYLRQHYPDHERAGEVVRLSDVVSSLAGG